MSCIFKSNNSAKTDVTSVAHHFTHHLNTARKAVNKRLRFVLSQIIESIAVRLSVMHDYRHIHIKRKFYLFFKNSVLQIFRNIPMIIKSRFSDSYNFFVL